MVVTKSTSSRSHGFWLDIVADPGDPYADAALPDMSDSYLQGDNALGDPDGAFSTIYEGYINGYLTLDMGKNEEIIDGVEDDFVILAEGGNYSISVTNSLDEAFIQVGLGCGNRSFDLKSSGISEARFIRITYSFGADIKLDAIVALHFNKPPSDLRPPYLIFNGDLHKLEFGSNTTLTWLASDETPWSFELYENSILVMSEYWNGSNIHYLFHPATKGSWNVTLVVFDAFGNVASDTVMIDVHEPSAPPSGGLLLFVGMVSLGAGVVAVVVIWIKKTK